MKVLVVSHSYAAAENQKNIAALRRHADVMVAVPHYINDRVIGLVTPGSEGDDTYLVRRRLSLPRSQYLLASSDMGMKGFKPDIIHIEYDPWATIFWQTCMASARHAPNARIVCTVKKNTLRLLPQPLQAMKERLARVLLNRVSHVIAINEGVRRIYESRLGVPAQKLTLMQHLGIDPQTFFLGGPNGEDRPLIVGYCGRIDRDKGVEDLIAAFAALIERQPGAAKLRLLGNGALRDRLAAGPEPWLEILPPVPHAAVADFMRGLDVFVMPALITPDHEEHGGHALMEAMACGVASIGSTSGIIPELLGDGCGIVFPAGDRVKLIEAIAAMLTDAGARKAFSQRALARATHNFSIDGIAAQKAEIYAKVLAT